MSDKNDLTVESAETKEPKRTYSVKYMVALVIILGLAHVLDEYTSIAPSMIKSNLVRQFFDISTEALEDQALTTWEASSFIMLFLMFFSNFFKGLQDKWGRKPVFIISVIGMTLGVFIQSISNSFGIYMIGSSIGGFFLFNDMQYVYINEETPTNKRAQAFTTAKIIGLAAIFLIPFIRDRFITETNNNWRPVLYFPIIVGVIVLVLGLVVLKETKAYRILQEERKTNPEKFKGEKITLRQATKDLKKTKQWSQIKWIIAAGMIAAPFAMVNASHSEYMMFELNFLEADKNLVLKLSTIGTGIIYLIQGQVADRLGRKPSYIMNLVLVIILVPLEYWALLNGHIILAGLSQGIRIGAFWNVTDVSRFVLIENVPTRLRGNAQVLSGLLLFAAMPIAILGTTILTPIVQYRYDLLLYWGLPFVIVTLIIVVWKLKETKHVDITTIEG